MSGAADHDRAAWIAPDTTPSPGADRPSAAGTCWTAMITAIPTVNPSTTGSGT
jgi:hypothetical protein